MLPDLLSELDLLPPRERLLSLVQGILAANIFDWGAKACVELYTNGKGPEAVFMQHFLSEHYSEWSIAAFTPYRPFCDPIEGSDLRPVFLNYSRRTVSLRSRISVIQALLKQLILLWW